jgi:hypothetical protein
MMTVHMCQFVAAVGRTNPKVRVAIIVASKCSIHSLQIGAVQHVFMPLEGYGGPGGDDERNKKNCTDDHIFNPLPKKLDR